jgi:hypothetical protein
MHVLWSYTGSLYSVLNLSLFICTSKFLGFALSKPLMEETHGQKKETIGPCPFLKVDS